jgi:hypothetical protein
MSETAETLRRSEGDEKPPPFDTRSDEEGVEYMLMKSLKADQKWTTFILSNLLLENWSANPRGRHDGNSDSA